jgi:hypothetical protein
MADPFDFSQSDPTAPGFLGVPVGTWRDLASFGGNLAAAANARTSQGFLANGPGLAGPLGAAIGDTMQQGRQNALSRSVLASQAAATQGQQLQNVGAASGLPLTIAKNRMLLNIYQNPELMQQLLGGGASNQTDESSGTSSSATLPSAVPSNYAQSILKSEGTGQNPLSSANGYGQFTDGTWQQFAKENPTYFQGMTPDQVMAARSDPKLGPTLGAAATDWLASKNAPVLSGAGVQPNGQALALSHYLGPQAAAAVMKAADDASAASVISAALGPQVAQQYVHANPNLAVQTAGMLKSRYSSVPTPGTFQIAQAGNGPIPVPSGAPQTGGAAPQLTGQQAMAKAQMLEQRANQVELARSLGLPIAGDPAALRQAAQQYRAMGLAGPTEAAKAAQANIDLRSGGMARVNGPNGPEWVKNPQLEKVQNPDGSFTYQHVTPPLPGAPEGTPGTSTPVIGSGGQPVVAQIPKQVQEARDKAYTDFAGKDTDAYISAQNTQSWLEQMNHAADTLNKVGGVLGTGPTSPARIAFANNVNDILRTAGLPTAFDPNAVGAWEELKKATTTAGFELSSHYEGHARQAAQTIMNATSAVPSATNSPIGFHVVSAGIQESAQQAIDLHNFKQDLYNSGGDLTKAEVDFYRANPAQMYARRAISTVTPYSISSDKELGRYLPGTFVQYKGKIVQVPERQGAPPIPEYLKNAQPSQ